MVFHESQTNQFNWRLEMTSDGGKTRTLINQIHDVRTKLSKR